MNNTMEWLNEAPHWNAQGKTITVVSGPKTDFWRKTFYGFTRDTGHFYGQTVQGDFVVAVKVTGQYKTLYDQAGLMLRVDEQNWMKCGIEWSVVPLPHNPPAIWLRVTRRQDSVEVQYALDGSQYTLLRLAYLVPVGTLSAGVMCASPEGDGFTTIFEDLSIQPLPASSS
jgi:regulation of enolase protein 1 (concanavalin A-like superfamily)